MIRGSTPATAVATMRARRRCIELADADLRRDQQRGGAVIEPGRIPAVTEPPSARNAGLSFANTSSVVSDE
jgi:hypothetical protein